MSRLAALVAAACVGPLCAQPQAPSLAPLFPVGLRAGPTAELTLGGSNLANPLGVLVGGDRAEVVADGQDAAKFRAKVTRPLAVGTRGVRVAAVSGASSLRLVCVDDLPEVAEGDANHAVNKAQTVTVPCVITGRCDAEKSDFFRFTASPNQRLSFEVLSRRLGSPFDPLLKFYRGDGREMPAVYCDDAPGLQADARLTHTFREGGEFVVELRDSTHRGGSDYAYRLRVGDFPCATTPLPAAIQRGQTATVRFAGPHADSAKPVEVAAPADPSAFGADVVPVDAATNLAGWPVNLRFSDHAELTEAEPNNAPDKAQRLPVPGGVTGRFFERGDLDVYVFTAKKGVPLTLLAETFEIQSPAEVYLLVKDAKGAELARADPAKPPRVEFTPPADGDYFAVLEHLNYLFGPAEAYRLVVTGTTPGADVALASDRATVRTGGGTVLEVQSVARRGAGPVELTVEGPAGFSGKAVIAAGAKPAAENQPLGLVPLRVADSVTPGLYEVVVRVSGGGVANTRTAAAKTLGDLPFLPANVADRVAVAVTPPQPLRLTLRADQAEVAAGSKLALTLIANRDGVTEDVTLMALGLPAGFTLGPAKPKLDKGATELKLELSVDAKAAPGSLTLALSGKTKIAGKDVTAVSEPLDVTVRPAK